MSGKTERATFIAIFGVCLFFCSTAALSVSSQASPKQWYSFTVSFGKNTGNVSINQNKIDKFVGEVVMPAINAFKIVETKGVWKGQSEDSFDLIVLSNQFNVTKRKLTKISLDYKKKFRQKSVLLYYQKATVSFL